MTVSVRIPTILRTFTGGAAEVIAGEGTLREVIAGLDATYPGIGGRIVDDTGKLRRFVNVYVGEEDVRFAVIAVQSVHLEQAHAACTPPR